MAGMDGLKVGSKTGNVVEVDFRSGDLSKSRMPSLPIEEIREDIENMKLPPVERKVTEALAAVREKLGSDLVGDFDAVLRGFRDPNSAVELLRALRKPVQGASSTQTNNKK